MSIAKKALVENGQDYIVKEMIARVMDCESYEGALKVICEYVTPIDKDTFVKERSKFIDIRQRKKCVYILLKSSIFKLASMPSVVTACCSFKG